MSRSPYAPPLPYGGWVLSLTILMGGFLWARREDSAADISTGNSSKNTSSNTGGDGDTSTSSSAWWDWGAGTSEDQEEKEEEEEVEEDEEQGGYRDRGFRTPSSAYQTDQEVGANDASVHPYRRRSIYGGP